MTDVERKKYINFMYDSDNEYRCEDCPENRGIDNWEGKLACGQQNCWVTCHCQQENEEI